MLASANHRTSRDHVKNHLLGGAGLRRVGGTSD